MDWYVGSGMDEFIVPNDEGLSDRLPLLDSWLKWGANSHEGSNMPNKYRDANFIREEINFDGNCFFDELDIENSFHDKDQSNGSNGYGGLSDESFQLASFSRGRPDYQLNDLTGIQQMDDIFMSSILEDPPLSRFSLPHESQTRMMPADSLFTDMLLDSQCISSDEHDLGSINCLDECEHANSSSIDWKRKCSTDSNSIPCNSGQSGFVPMQVLLAKKSGPHEKNNGKGHEEKSVEESVLQDFEMLMVQLNDNTRICFRDSLYRLASNSRKQNVETCSINDDRFLEKIPPWSACDETLRSARKRGESKTNTIDRAIANLMYNKMESNVHNISGTTMANFEQEVVKQKKHKHHLQSAGKGPHHSLLISAG